MFESANYLLKCPFTGTVNHLELIVERYLRRKTLINQTFDKDGLSTMLSKLLGKKDGAYFTSRIDVTKVPEEYLAPEYFGKLFSTRNYNDLKLDSLCNPGGHKNSYVSFTINQTRYFGQMAVFVQEDHVINCIVQIYKVKRIYRCPVATKTELLSFVVVEHTDKLLEIPIQKIEFKLLKILKGNECFLVPILRHFEHD